MKIIKHLLLIISILLPGEMQASAAQRVVSPTLAFLTHQELLKAVRDKFGKQIDQCKDKLIKPVLVKEAQHAKTHTPFYHAQNMQYLVLYDVLEAIYKALYPDKKVDHFTFMRFWHSGIAQKTAQEFIDAHEKGDSVMDWNDGKKGLAQYILSVNYSLFGNVIGGSCSFDYFLNNTNNVMYGLDDFLNPVFEYYKFDKKYIKQLNDLNGNLRSKHGIVCQLLIPHDLVDKCVYISSPGGTPYRSQIKGVDGFDDKKNRYTKITPLLQAYRANPALVRQSIEGVQARVVFVPEMLDPESGVKIFRYSNMDDKTHDEYKQKVGAVCQQMVSEWKKQHPIKAKL